MTRIPPTKTENSGAGGEGDQYTHPAFGFITINRVQGGDPRLFMSNVEHSNRVQITIGSAKMERRHHEDVHYMNREAVVVEMSSVQFADLMAGFGSASGVPCTLRRMRDETGKYEMIPGIAMDTTMQRHAQEMKKSFDDLAARVTALEADVRKKLDDAKVSKTKQADILGPLTRVAREIRSEIPFMEEQFRGSVEGVVQEAKAVVESFARERGIESGVTPLLLGNTE